MQQYFIKDAITDVFALNDEDYHHIVNVMRFEIGAKLRVAIAKDKIVYLCEILEITESQVIVKKIEQLEEERELQHEIVFAVGLLRNQNFELVVQKLTELGVTQIIPWEADFSVARLKDKAVMKKIERWSKIAEEASEQSKRHLVPEILTPMNSKQLSAVFENYDHVLVASETLSQEKTAQIILSLELPQREGTKILVIIGPEGGISPQEHDMFAKETNTMFISLGKRILRAETAALSAMSVLAAKLEM